ncbi:hypothetical protein [Mesorhizobium sp. A556]
MREIILAGVFAFSASTCLAQTTTAPQPASPEAASPAVQSPALQQGGPANLCQEILLFMKSPPEAAVSPGATKPATTGGQQEKSQQSASNQQGSSALAGTTATDKAISGDSGSNSAQAVTGQKGVATDAPEPGKDNADSGSVANAPQKESRSAPTPPADVTSTPRESVLTMEEARQLADAGDTAQCQKMARKMRVAGVSMPPPLIALAALDLQHQQKSGVATEPSGSAVPAGDE